ncbi:hypothetical protein AU512_07575 [Lonsdalea iberica]|uniref:Cytosine permease n=1 Tax=Lonsdalea iberica TaxID=1082703 RepID=A0A1X3S160_9GAMM|nr:hypothetical protein AU511_01665 [Lonsdalea iberica]OSN10643.1 hypothetical protein AU512_07575 [Lonsdalea iberica]
MSERNEFPLSETPKNQRKGLLSISMVLFSCTFFTATMFAGGKLGVAFPLVGIAASAGLYILFTRLTGRRAVLTESKEQS